MPTATRAFESPAWQFSFEMGSGDRTYVFCTHSRDEEKEWMRQLKLAVDKLRKGPSAVDATRSRRLVSVSEDNPPRSSPGMRQTSMSRSLRMWVRM